MAGVRMVVCMQHLQSFQLQVLLPDVFQLFLQLVVVLLQSIVQFDKGLALLLETLLRLNYPSAQDSVVHLQSLYHVFVMAVFMLQLMNFGLQFIFIFSLRLFQFYFKFFQQFGERYLSKGHELFQFFRQSFLVNFFYLFFKHQFIVFQSLDLFIKRWLRLFQQFNFSSPFLELNFQLLNFLIDFIDLCLVLLLLANSGLQKLLFFVAQIPLKTHNFVLQQHQFARLQFQLLLQLKKTLPPQRTTLHVHTLSLNARFEVGALSGTVRTGRSETILSLCWGVSYAQKKVFGLNRACIRFIIYRLIL